MPTLTQNEIKALLASYNKHIAQSKSNEMYAALAAQELAKLKQALGFYFKRFAIMAGSYLLHLPVWGFTAMKLWNWFLAMGPVPTISLVHAVGVGLAAEFIFDITSLHHKQILSDDIHNLAAGKASCFDSWPMSDNWCLFIGSIISYCTGPVMALLVGWLIKIIMYL